jgi:cytochrome P450
MLGLPEADIPRLKQWSAAWILPFVRKLEPNEDAWVAEQVVEMYDYLAEMIAWKRREPGDDIITHLTQAPFTGDDHHPHGRPLTDQEIITIVDHLFIGGNETTTFAMVSAIWIMLRDDGLYTRLQSDPSLIPNFVEEVLRLESPTQGLWRAVAEDTEIGGVPIPAGSWLHVIWASANRDDAVFDAPERFNIDRPDTAKQLAFGLGTHFCLGAPLARMEGRVALTTLFTRLRDLRLADRPDAVAWRSSATTRTVSELHVTFERR